MYAERLLNAGERKELESQMKTVFSRPWTPLFIDTVKQHDVVDRDLVGHRGVEIGKVETVYRPGRGDDRISVVAFLADRTAGVPIRIDERGRVGLGVQEAVHAPGVFTAGARSG